MIKLLPRVCVRLRTALARVERAALYGGGENYFNFYI